MSFGQAFLTQPFFALDSLSINKEQDLRGAWDPCVPDAMRGGGWTAVPRACPPARENMKSKGLSPES